MFIFVLKMTYVLGIMISNVCCQSPTNSDEEDNIGIIASLCNLMGVYINSDISSLILYFDNASNIMQITPIMKIMSTAKIMTLVNKVIMKPMNQASAITIIFLIYQFKI